MLIAITLRLRSPTNVTLPTDLGRAAYAALLHRLGELDASLAAQLHDDSGPKPFTCSSLLNAPARREGLHIRADQPYFLRVTGLTPLVSAALEEGILRNPPSVWELDHHPFEVVEAMCDAAQDPWSGRDSYENLAAGHLLPGEPFSRSLMLHFATPTSFRSQNINLPLPLPGLVFGSLAERWNSFSPVGISPEARRFGEEMVAISQYRLESRAVSHKSGSLRIGGVGEVAYRALNDDRYWLGVLHLLASFARFSGVGVQTTTGMGQVRQLTSWRR